VGQGPQMEGQAGWMQRGGHSGCWSVGLQLSGFWSEVQFACGSEEIHPQHGPRPLAGRLDRMHDPAPSHPSTYVVCTTGCDCPELSSLELLAVGVRSAQWAQSLVRWP
jgi:glycosyltransferase A (GT-A) superfamily protein (DUF2064 family)